ncbi:MAG: spermidine synthase [Kiritimatiellia bacterium]
MDVCENVSGYDFQVEGATHATFRKDRLMTGQAWDAITAGCLLHPREPETLLMLGLAGGTAVRQLRHLLPSTEIVAIEIDAEMVRIAKKYMGVDALSCEILIADAHDFLTHDTRRFDVIVDDIYVSSLEEVEKPFAPTDRLFELFKDHLKPQGILCTNLVTGAGHRNVQTKTRKAFKRHFTEVRSITPPESHNETLIGGEVLGPVTQYVQRLAELPAPYDRAKWSELDTRRLK